MTFAQGAFGLAGLLLLLGGLSGLLLPTTARRFLTNLLTAIGAGAACVGAIRVFTSNEPLSIVANNVLPFGQAVFEIDELSAFFMLVIGVVAIPAAIYAVGYTKHGLSSRTTQAMFPVFVLSMLLVVSAASMATFLICWELMAITSLVLVVTEHRHRDARSAGIWYAAMTHFGFLAILVGFAILSMHAPLDTFGVIGESSLTITPWLRSLAFLLFFVGFASKAGAVPFHVWLPRAHAEAPSHVSALMSGAMVKMGIYGIVRVCWDLMGLGSRWWYMVILAVGIVSAIFGILHAMASHDLKRLLAYSTSENIGLILIALGAAGIYKVGKSDALAAFAVAAALLHVLNHAVFKGLLFLSAGSVLFATHNRNLDQLGGLAKRMPFTMLTFAIGAMAISAIPPLNGFASEWLMLQSLFQGIPSDSAYRNVLFPLALGAMALAGGLVAATFVKALGTGFLALPRSESAAEATEVGGFMKIGQLLLAITCVVLGFGASFLSGLLTRTVASLRGLYDIEPINHHHAWMQLPGSSTRLSTLVIGAVLIGAVILTIVVLRLLRSPAKARVAPTWACGRELQTPRMEYTSTSYAEPLRRVFANVLRPDSDISVDRRNESQYFVQSVHYYLDLRDVIERRFYTPLLTFARKWGELGRQLQNGSIHRYLAYIMVALLCVLVIAR